MQLFELIHRKISDTVHMCNPGLRSRLGSDIMGMVVMTLFVDVTSTLSMHHVRDPPESEPDLRSPSSITKTEVLDIFINSSASKNLFLLPTLSPEKIR